MEETPHEPREPKGVDGSLPAIIRALVIAAILGLAGWVLAQESRMGQIVRTLAVIQDRQDFVLRRVDALEVSAHPATARRYTADDATRDREANTREHQQLENRILRLEQRK